MDTLSAHFMALGIITPLLWRGLLWKGLAQLNSQFRSSSLPWQEWHSPLACLVNVEMEEETPSKRKYGFNLLIISLCTRFTEFSFAYSQTFTMSIPLDPGAPLHTLSPYPPIWYAVHCILDFGCPTGGKWVNSPFESKRPLIFGIQRVVDGDRSMASLFEGVLVICDHQTTIWWMDKSVDWKGHLY